MSISPLMFATDDLLSETNCLIAPLCCSQLIFEERSKSKGSCAKGVIEAEAEETEVTKLS